MKKSERWIAISLCIVIIIGLSIYIFSLLGVDVPQEAIRESRDTHVETSSDNNADEAAVDVPPEQEVYPEEEPPELLPRIVQLREDYDNPDIIGFIEIPNTNISYPVAQTGNNSFYLYHDLNWNPTAAGSIFLDYENDLYALADDNTIIYGHNMRGGTKFHNIRYFHGEDFFRAHTYILLDTPYRETVWDIFSFFHTTIDFCYLTTNFFTREAFYEFLLELQGRSHFETDIVLTDSDQILILSTCGVVGGDNRYVVVARLRQDVES